MISEQEYIAHCKRLIEKKFSFGNGHGYSQRDLEQLSVTIEEKTGVLISLSTLKRLWKDDYKHSPQLATLNALVQVLDFKDWQDFKMKTEIHHDKPARPRTTHRLPRWMVVSLIIVPVVIMVLVLFRSGRGVNVHGPVTFEASKTVSKGVPNTVVFTYDLLNVEADSFFIQESWNNFRKQRIDPKKHTFTNIYYEAGFHRAKLIANDKILSVLPIHILSDGWEPHIYYNESDARFMDLKGEKFIQDGQLHISKALLQKRNIDGSRYFESRISNSQVFNVSSDNFSMTSRVKLDRVIDSNCPWLALLIVTEKHIFKVTLIKQGCEMYADYKLGEIYKGGKENDLSKLGCDVYDWHDITIQVDNKKADILIDGAFAYSETYREDYGAIVGITYIFEGVGSLDFVSLKNEMGDVVFEDDFDGGQL